MTHLRQLLYGELSEVEEAAERARSIGGVSSVIWLLTYRCNLNCLHCYQGGRSSDELSMGEWLRIVDKLERAGRPLIFISGGEPLIRGDTLPLLKELKVRGFRTVLSTNGTLIGSDIVGEISESVDNVALPLYGPEEFHDAFTRVQGSYNRVIKSLDLLKGSTKLTLKTVVSRSTVKHLSHLLEIASRYDVGTLYLCDLIPSSGMEGEVLSVVEWRELVDKLIRILLDTGVEVDIGLHPSAGIYAMLKLGHTVTDVRKRLSGRRLAREGKGFISLAPNGDVLVSNYAPDLKLGNLLRDSLAELLNRELYLKLGSSESVKGYCSKCPLRDACGGSRVKAYFYSGDALGEDPTCLVKDMLA